MENIHPPDQLLEAHHVLVPTDSVFQRRARLLQALWREEQGLPIARSRARSVEGFSSSADV